MHRRLTITLIFSLAALAGFPLASATAQGRDDSGRSFYRACKAELGKPRGRCEDYLEGVADMLAAFGNGGHPGGICGSRYGDGELTKIYVAWMPKHSDFGRLPRAAGAAIALRDKWPCRPGNDI